MTISDGLIKAAKGLSEEVGKLKFGEPVQYIYNPLEYAWKPHERYLKRFGNSSKRVVFMGMNPGPWGMSQTGVPFGEIAAVKDWMGIEETVDIPQREHPKRPIQGFQCQKSEVSGRRLWGLFAEQFESAEEFFEEHFVLNYCPLVFMEESSRNRTPDKLPASENKPLFSLCNQHLRECVELLDPEWIVGIGGFAQARAKDALEDLEIKRGKVLHPSPASPAANRGWSQAALKQLLAQEIWKS